MATLPSNATPKMLEWARRTANYSVEDVAAAEKVEPAKLKEWESGIGTPSLAMLRKLGKRYKRPLMVFYLQEPPAGFSVVKDFRLLPEGAEREFSPELAYAIRFAQERQAWAAAYLESLGQPKSDLVGSANTGDDPRDVARDLRTRLGLDASRQASCVSESDAFTTVRRLVEKLGVFVFQTSKVEVAEMRGFALPHVYAPAVVVNSRDYYRPKTFTLIHEVAHVLINEPSVSGTGRAPLAFSPNIGAERFCNQVAAETLVPAQDFKARVPQDWKQRGDEFVKSLSRIYWVSQDVIRLRLVEIGFAPQRYFTENLSTFVPPKARSSGPIPQSKLAAARSGESFSRLTLSAFRGGELHGAGLTSLLGMTLKHVSALESLVFPVATAGA